MLNYLLHPIVLALIAGSIAFVLMYYFYDPVDKNKKKNKKNEESTNRKEKIIIVSAIVALLTWFLAKIIISWMDDPVISINDVDIKGDNFDVPNQLTNQQEVSTNPVNPANPVNIANPAKSTTVGQQSGGGNINLIPNAPQQNMFDGNSNYGNGKSYNFLGKGLDIPRNEIPKVLIDYK